MAPTIQDKQNTTDKNNKPLNIDKKKRRSYQTTVFVS